jgi:ammonia channel protein AmtB
LQFRFASYTIGGAFCKCFLANFKGVITSIIPLGIIYLENKFKIDTTVDVFPSPVIGGLVV